ncbi:MAG TPA: endonuclease MutS2 [Planctomycetota bacterium]|nr:endonuclease MutS2 [Planctomycetota bacterium]
MDPHSLEVLEYAKVKAMLAGYAACSLGKAAVQDLQPLTDAAAVRRAIGETSELRELLQRRGRLPVAGMTDVRPAIRGTQEGERAIEPSTLLDIRGTLLAGKHMKALFEEEADAFPLLASLGEGLEDLEPLCVQIDAAIGKDGLVRDDASPKLAVVRSRLGAAMARLRDKAYALAASASLRPLLQSEGVCLRHGRFVLAVKAELKRELDGIILDRSQTGATVFIEPRELVLLANEADDLRFEERREVERILWELTLAIGEEREPILRTLEALARIDCTYAKARFSVDYGMTAPEINDQGHLNIRRARHPVLVRVLERGGEGGGGTGILPVGAQAGSLCHQAVTPIDYRLGEDFDLLVVTGPNTGGKTVALKTIGLLSLMAQSGLHVPADRGARLPVYEDILADIGDEQSIEQSLSTFSSHVNNLVRILAKTRRRTLVLLDELGAGTDPAEGAALGTAVLDFLGQRRASVVVTTHIGDLKAYAYRHGRALNAACEFDQETLQPTYRLLLGQPGNSNAVAIAERLGLPAEVIGRAREALLRTRGRDTELIAELEQSRKAIEDDREQAHQLRKEAEALRARVDAELKAATAKARTSRHEAEQEIDEQVRRVRSRVLEALRQLHNAPAPFADKAREVAAVLEAEFQRTPLAEKRLEFARSLHKDDVAHVISLGARCRVKSINRTKERLEVVFGHAVVEVGFDDVTWVEPGREEA